MAEHICVLLKKKRERKKETNKLDFLTSWLFTIGLTTVLHDAQFD